jgi:hypothetical protein
MSPYIEAQIPLTPTGHAERFDGEMIEALSLFK